MILLLACAKAPTDADFDGFPAEEDCNDEDALVYPGAPDRAGDGLDTDCDGEDAPLAYLGGWTFTWFEATYSGIPLLVPDDAAGTLLLADDWTVDAAVLTSLDPILYGTAVEIEILMTGSLSPLQSDDELTLYAEGENFDELMHVAFDCVLLSETELACEGELKALDLSLDATALLVR